MKVSFGLASVLATTLMLSNANQSNAYTTEEIRSYFTTRLQMDEIKEKFKTSPGFSKLTDADLMSLNQVGRQAISEKDMPSRVKTILKSKETGALAREVIAEARLSTYPGFRLLDENSKETLRLKETGKEVAPEKVSKAKAALEKVREAVEKEVAQDKAKQTIKSEFVCEGCGRG